MTDRPRPQPLSERVLAAAIVAVGVCALRPESWLPADLAFWLEPPVLFAAALCASAVAQADALRSEARGCDTRWLLRRITRSAYLKIYLVVGIGEAMAWIDGDLRRPQTLHQLRVLLAWGIVATVAARVWAGLRARRPASAPISPSALGPLRLRNGGEFALSAEPPGPLPPSTDDRS